MSTVVTDNPELQRFEISVDGVQVGHADYRIDDGVMAIPHTEINPAHEGQGLGGALVEDTLLAARERGLRVVPLCSFVAAYIRRHPEHSDLVAGRAA